MSILLRSDFLKWSFFGIVKERIVYIVFRRFIFILVISFAIVHPIKAQKEITPDEQAKAAISASDICAIEVARMEKKYAIKDHLLETIASVETGIWDHQKEAFVSWPWSINVNGKGYRFDSKEEAIREVKRLQESGIQSIDVGCMQISLKYHGKSFDSLDEAFNPEMNVEYSAKFLKKLYDKKGSWQKAALAYHSKIPEYALKYKNRLLKRFEKIKVAFLDAPKEASLF